MVCAMSPDLRVMWQSNGNKCDWDQTKTTHSHGAVMEGCDILAQELRATTQTTLLLQQNGGKQSVW